MQPSFEKESIELKQECLNYIIKNIAIFPKADVKSYVQPILACLIDKNKETRGLGE